MLERLVHLRQRKHLVLDRRQIDHARAHLPDDEIDALSGIELAARELGAKVVTISGPDGYILDEEGMNAEKAAYMTEVEAWRELDDGRIEFTMRRLPTAD